MKNIYIVVGAVAIAAAAFITGMYYDRYSAAVDSLQGTVVARDASSITVRLADNSVKTVRVGEGTSIFAQTEPLSATLDSLTPGRQVRATLEGGMASMIFMTVQPPTSTR